VLGAPLGRIIVTVEVLSVVVAIDAELRACADACPMKAVAITAVTRNMRFPPIILSFVWLGL
jgi:hypothetical protein